MPKSILAEGRFVERPDIIQGYLPLGLEMTYVPALRLGGEAAANLMHWLFLPLTACLLWSCGDRLFGRPAGAMAVALFAAVPLALADSATASSDLSMTFYIVLTAILVVELWQTPEQKIAALAGAFGGLSLAFKIVSGFYLVPLCLVAAAVLLRRGNRTSFLRQGTAFAVLGLVMGAPWLVLRWAETGNPVFPFFNNIFRSNKWPPVNERFDLYLYGIGHGLRGAAEIWWQASVHPSLFGQPLPPWSLGLPVLASLAALPAMAWVKPGRPALFWTALAFLAFGAWFLFSQYHRYALPAVALLALPAGAALAASLQMVAAKYAAVTASLLAALWFAGAMTIALAIPRPDPYPERFLLGRETRAQYRERVIPDYLPISFLNAATVGGRDQGLIYGYPYNYFTSIRLYDTNLPATLSPGRRLAESGLRSGDLARALLAADLRWLGVDNSIPPEDQESSRWLAGSLFSPDFLGRYTEAVFERYNVVVYKIVGDQSPDGVE